MNYQTPLRRRTRRGFTLIELLVVIAIIAILAAMGFGAGMMAIDKAKKAAALNDCTNLVQAVQAYYDDYSSLPDVQAAATAPGAKTEPTLMNILVGFDEQQNPKKTRFFQGRDAKGTSSERAYNGIFYTQSSAELFDPWRKVSGSSRNERHYYVMMDLDYNEELEDPFGNSRPLYGKQAIAWCTGKDGKYTSGNTTSTDNRDNVYSWK